MSASLVLHWPLITHRGGQSRLCHLFRLVQRDLSTAQRLGAPRSSWRHAKRRLRQRNADFKLCCAATNQFSQRQRALVRRAC